MCKMRHRGFLWTGGCDTLSLVPLAVAPIRRGECWREPPRPLIVIYTDMEPSGADASRRLNNAGGIRRSCVRGVDADPEADHSRREQATT